MRYAYWYKVSKYMRFFLYKNFNNSLLLDIICLKYQYAEHLENIFLFDGIYLILYNCLSRKSNICLYQLCKCPFSSNFSSQSLATFPFQFRIMGNNAKVRRYTSHDRRLTAARTLNDAMRLARDVVGTASVS